MLASALWISSAGRFNFNGSNMRNTNVSEIVGKSAVIDIARYKKRKGTWTPGTDSSQREEDSNSSVIVLDFPLPGRLSLCYWSFVQASASCLPNEVIVFPYQL